MYVQLRRTTGAPPMHMALNEGDNWFHIESKDGSFLDVIHEHCSWCAKSAACVSWSESTKQSKEDLTAYENPTKSKED